MRIVIFDDDQYIQISGHPGMSISFLQSNVDIVIGCSPARETCQYPNRFEKSCLCRQISFFYLDTANKITDILARELSEACNLPGLVIDQLDNCCTKMGFLDEKKITGENLDKSFITVTINLDYRDFNTIYLYIVSVLESVYL